MNDNIHWRLEELNQHLHSCSSVDKEVHMWRDRYVKEHMKDESDYCKHVFLSLPSQFMHKHVEDVVKNLCRTIDD